MTTPSASSESKEIRVVEAVRLQGLQRLDSTIGDYRVSPNCWGRPRHSTVMATFLVVDCPTTYNTILGRLSLNQYKAITLVYHLAMKFPTPRGNAALKEEKKEARECYNMSLRITTKPSESMTMMINGGLSQIGATSSELDPQFCEEV
uniref:Uncharacterized protein n=1 Tax=Cannabis sativa TaxID=3483 RepID=A0A803PTE1_CANSA